MEKINEILMRIRTTLGVKTDKQMCEKLGIAYGTLDNWKARKKIPQGRILEIANKINVKPEWLLIGLSNNTRTNDIACELMANAPEQEYKNIDDIKQRLGLSTDQIAKLFRMEVSQIIKMKNNNIPIPNDLQQSARVMERVIYSLKTTFGGQDMDKNWGYIHYENSNTLVQDKKLELIVKLIRYANDELMEQVMARLNEIERLSKI